MYRSTFGTKGQVHFNNEHEYYAFLGYLTKNDGSTRLTWENNEEQGAWGSEGRIQIYAPDFPFSNNVQLTAGNGSMLYRVNCNEFIEHINRTHNFQNRVYTQDRESIRSTIPVQYQSDFDRGVSM